MRFMRILDLIFLGLWLVGLASFAIFVKPLPADAEMFFWLGTVALGIYFSVSFFIKRFFIRREYKDEFDI